MKAYSKLLMCSKCYSVEPLLSSQSELEDSESMSNSELLSSLLEFSSIAEH